MRQQNSSQLFSRGTPTPEMQHGSREKSLHKQSPCEDTGSMRTAPISKLCQAMLPKEAQQFLLGDRGRKEETQ